MFSVGLQTERIAAAAAYAGFLRRGPLHSCECGRLLVDCVGSVLSDHHHHHHEVIYSAPTTNVGRRCITMIDESIS